MSGAVHVTGLRPGDRIGIAAPAAPANAGLLARGLRVLEGMGFRTRVGSAAATQRGYLAGPDAARAGALNELIDDPEVRAILFARGGFGTGRILDRIHLDELRRRPRVLVGFSDLTALLMALQRGGPYPVGYGPHLSDLGRPARFQAGSLRRFLVDPDRPVAVDLRRCRTLVDGNAQGILQGGCLTLLQSLLGTPWQPDLRGSILFWEDWNEEPYRIDRMLTHLQAAGALEGIRGMVVGRPIRVKARRGQPSLSLEEILLDHAGPLGVPVVLGIPAGHCPRKLTLPLGLPARLDTRRGVLEIGAAVP